MILEKEFVNRLINNPDNIGRTSLKPRDIGVPAYRAAYSELLRQVQAGTKPDLATIITALPDHRRLLLEMNFVDTANFEFYDKKLSGEVKRRNLVMASEYLAMALQSGADTQEILETLESKLVEIGNAGSKAELNSLFECATQFMPILEKRWKNKGQIVGIPTGFLKLDGMTSGFQPGTYYIGARPSQGKTALMLTMMRSAVKAGHSVGLISIESSQTDLISRVISADAKVRASALKHGAMVKSDYPKLTESIHRLKGYKGQVYFNTKTDTGILESVARMMVGVNGVEIIYIDYLQRINAQGGTKFEQVAKASRIVTDIAKGLNIPVVCLVQTGRVADKEEPSLNHFQYSSAIEQDADVAIIIHNEERDSGPDISKLCVLKNRDGETGDVHVFFNREYVSFEEVNN